MTIAKNIAELRTRNNMTQEELAFKVGVSRQAVTKWESGDSAPELSKLIALADIFGTSVDKLVGRESTLYDILISKLNDLSADCTKTEEIDVLPFVTRFLDYGKSIGWTDEQLMKGVLTICGHDGTD